LTNGKENVNLFEDHKEFILGQVTKAHYFIIKSKIIISFKCNFTRYTGTKKM